MYNKFRLKRVYYSAYVPVNSNPNLPDLKSPPLLREHRLYQADWLLRFYGFSADELLDDRNPDFSEDYDPKTDWALRNLNYFPLEINRASYEQLLRVPGIGVKSARRILAARRMHALRFEDLKTIGVTLKRAQYFITCRGKYSGEAVMEEHILRPRLALSQPSPNHYEQLNLFSFLPELVPRDEAVSTITGEL
jgi:predicted DNA-binding helix-hairpin-helix protein